MGWKLALATALIPSAAWGQDCDVDADCGHGFQCIHTSSGSAVTGGVGGSAPQAECGDNICDFAAEDVDSCPQDCDTLQYCAPAECDSDTDCAEGYECAEESSSSGTSGFTSAGGSSGSVCGDGVCDFDESGGSCVDDCPIIRTCRVEQTQCASNDDCADGFYCDFGGSAEGSAVAVSSVGSTGGTDDTVSASADSGSDGSDSGSSGTTDSGFVPPPDTGSATSGGEEVGVCLPESSSSTGGAGSTDDTVGGSGMTVGGSATDSGATGPSAASGVGGASSAESATGGDSDASASDGNESGGSAGEATGAGGANPDTGSDDDESGDDEGCSCAIVKTEGSSGLVAALLFGLAVGVRRRRSGTVS